MRHLRYSLAAAPLALALLATPAMLLTTTPAQAQFGVGVSITIAPPVLPVYVQPPLPAPGYLWTPGFWNYGEGAGYFWVPGTWVQPPSLGLLWTPGYWGFNNGYYAFNRGYWGPHVGFYGGINYGFGYGGIGFEGGEWRGGAFAYNSAVNNFGGVHVTNVYNRTVINNTTINRVSFNGPHGIDVRPTPEQASFAREQHVNATELQQQHERAAAQNPDLRASFNHGNPPIAATARPAEFRGPGIVPARPVGTPMARPAEAARINEPSHVTPVHNTGPRPVGMAAHPVLRGPGPAYHPSSMPQHYAARPMAPPRAAPAPHPAAAPHPAERPGEHRQ
jgi:hypothetical protein